MGPQTCTDVCDRRSLWWTEGGQTLAGVPPPFLVSLLWLLRCPLGGSSGHGSRGG